MKSLGITAEGVGSKWSLVAGVDKFSSQEMDRRGRKKREVAPTHSNEEQDGRTTIPVEREREEGVIP